jgi:hypothetical protein
MRRSLPQGSKSMKADFDQVSSQLKQASQLLSAGQLELACARITAASDLLDSCIAESARQQTSALEPAAATDRQEVIPAAMAQTGLAMAG